MKDILVSYTRQEKDEATGKLHLNHKGHNPQYRRKIPTQ